MLHLLQRVLLSGPPNPFLNGHSPERIPCDVCIMLINPEARAFFPTVALPAFNAVGVKRAQTRPKGLMSFPLCCSWAQGSL